jgi:MFS family permease
MEASGTSSVHRDADDIAEHGGAVAGAAGTAAPAAATPPSPPAAGSEAPSQSRRGFGSRETLILTVCCVAQFMVILDLSIVNVALPSIQSSLNFTSADLQWVVDAYAIAFAGFLMLGGRAADKLGQRRVFVAALVLFSITSLVGGAAVNRQMLIVARGVQGFSCAFMAASLKSGDGAVQKIAAIANTTMVSAMPIPIITCMMISSR